MQDSHKTVIQNVFAAPVPGAVTTLWSSSRDDQIACLSTHCYSAQGPTGNYSVQRVEGWGISSSVGLGRDSDGSPMVQVGGRGVKLAPMTFAWSSMALDNWVGTNTSYPDASYSGMGDNGLVVADEGVAGTVPLQVYARVYSAGHTDWAAIASPDGIAWAQSNGYTFQYTTVRPSLSRTVCFAPTRVVWPSAGLRVGIETGA